MHLITSRDIRRALLSNPLAIDWDLDRDDHLFSFDGWFCCDEEFREHCQVSIPRSKWVIRSWPDSSSWNHRVYFLCLSLVVLCDNKHRHRSIVFRFSVSIDNRPFHTLANLFRQGSPLPIEGNIRIVLHIFVFRFLMQIDRWWLSHIFFLGYHL